MCGVGPDFNLIFNFQPYLTIAGLAGICSCLEIIVVSAPRLACSVQVHGKSTFLCLVKYHDQEAVRLSR